MSKKQFFYIGKSYDSRKVEGDTFKAYRYKDVEGYVDFISNFNKLSIIQIATIKAKYYPLIS